MSAVSKSTESCTEQHLHIPVYLVSPIPSFFHGLRSVRPK